MVKIVDYTESEEENAEDKNANVERKELAPATKIDKIKPAFRHLKGKGLKNKVRDLLRLRNRKDANQKIGDDNRSLRVVKDLKLSAPKHVNYIDVESSARVDTEVVKPKGATTNANDFSSVMHMNEEDIKMLKIQSNPQDYSDKYHESRKTRAKYGW